LPDAALSATVEAAALGRESRHIVGRFTFALACGTITKSVDDKPLAWIVLGFGVT
jgi:hypothetical protein